MPTKRRFIIFLIVLALMLLIKRAVGQETGPVGWDPALTCGGYNAEMPDEVQSILTQSSIAGLLLGSLTAWMRAAAERRGTYVTGDLIQLRLQ